MKLTKPGELRSFAAYPCVLRTKRKVRSVGLPAITRRAQRQLCITVEEDGVWIYANRGGLRALARRIGALASADPAEHHELHLKWHLGSHGKDRGSVFVLLDSKAGKAHSRARFEVTVMAVEQKDLQRLRQHDKTGRLPRSWRRE
jgi:hypothetical protein